MWVRATSTAPGNATFYVNLDRFVVIRRDEGGAFTRVIAREGEHDIHVVETPEELLKHAQRT